MKFRIVQLLCHGKVKYVDDHMEIKFLKLTEGFLFENNHILARTMFK